MGVQFDSLLHHFGGFSGFHAHVSFLPDAGLGVAILVNESRAGMVFSLLLASYAYETLLERPDVENRYDDRLEDLLGQLDVVRQRVAADRQRRAGRSQQLPHPLEAYTGNFSNPHYGTVEVRKNGERLEASMGPLWSQVEVYDGARNALRVELTGGGTVVTYSFDDQGRATALSQGPVVFERRPD